MFAVNNNHYIILEVGDKFRDKDYIDWAIRTAKLDKVKYRGKSQRVGILDTGCDINCSDLKGAVEGFSTIIGNSDKPVWQDKCGHGCIQPDAIIMTNNGPMKIKDIYDKYGGEVTETDKFHDEGTIKYFSKEVKEPLSVISYFNNAFEYNKVTHVHRISYKNQKIIKVKTRFGELLLTPWHPVYVYLREQVRLSLFETYGEPTKIRADQLNKEEHLLVSTGSRYGLVNDNNRKESFVINTNNGRYLDLFMWFAGLLHNMVVVKNNALVIEPVPDGVELSFKSRLNTVDIEQVLERMMTALRELYTGIEVIKTSTKTSYKIKAHLVGDRDKLINTLNIIAGNGDNTIIKMLTRAGVTQLKTYFAGWYDGEAVIEGDRLLARTEIPEVVIKSSNSQLIELLYKVIAAYGFEVKVNNDFCEITYGRDVVTGTVSSVCTSIHYLVGHNARYNDSKVEILSIEQIDYTGDLYDLTVENAHNYLADNVIVSNTVVTSLILARENNEGIRGVAPEAEGLHIRVLYGDERDYVRYDVHKDIARAINYAVTNGKCKVLNMSFGDGQDYPEIKEAIDNAVNNGVIPIAAAGNSRLYGSYIKIYPAAYDNVISVAAANKDRLPAWFSTFNKSDMALELPEVAVASLEYYWGTFPGNNYGKVMGTSFAAPIISGLALLWLEYKEEKGELPQGPDVLVEFRRWLRQVSVDTNKNGWDPELGFGVLEVSDKAFS